MEIVPATAVSLQSYPTLCDPIEDSQPGSSIPGILQARILEWVAISFSNACMHAKSLQLCPTLCDPMDSSPPGSSVHKILQARILEWFATFWVVVNERSSFVEVILLLSPLFSYCVTISFHTLFILSNNIMKQKLESKFLGEISITSDMWMIPPL